MKLESISVAGKDANQSGVGKKYICAFFSTLPHNKFNKGIQVKLKNI